jgi:hypothetical protein
MRISDLIENDQGAPASVLRQIFPLGFRQRLGFEKCALVHSFRPEQTIEIARRDAFDGWLKWADRFDKPALSVFGEQKAVSAAGGIFQRRLHGVQTEKPERTVLVIPCDRI